MSISKTLSQLHNLLSKYTGILSGTFCLLLLLASTYALYDVQTAQGIGLYLSIQTGIPHTLTLDILCTVVFMLAMLLLMLLPCFILKHRSAASMLRFLALYMALIPAIDTAYLIHLADGHALFTLPPALANGNIKQAFTDASVCLLPLLQLILPICILLYGCYLTISDTAEDHKHTPLPLWHKAFMVISLILCIPMMFFPELTPVSEYIVWYLLLLLCFDLWEKVLARRPRLQSASHILTALFILRSIYRLLDLMSHYRL